MAISMESNGLQAMECRQWLLPCNGEPGDDKEGQEHKYWQQDHRALVGVLTPQHKGADGAK